MSKDLIWERTHHRGFEEWWLLDKARMPNPYRACVRGSGRAALWCAPTTSVRFWTEQPELADLPVEEKKRVLEFLVRAGEDTGP